MRFHIGVLFFSIYWYCDFSPVPSQIFIWYACIGIPRRAEEPMPPPPLFLVTAQEDLLTMLQAKKFHCIDTISHSDIHLLFLIDFS